MIPRDAIYDLLEHTVKEGNKRIETWTRQVEDLQEQIAKFNRWIVFEQGDIDDAQNMLNAMDAKNEESQNETRSE